MNSTPELLAAAVELHRAGQLAQAEQVYRHILAADPQVPDAWHLLGVIAHQSGDHAAALECIGRAIALHPRDPAYYGNLGSVLNTLDRNPEAVAAFEHSLALDPQQPKPWFNYGNALRALARTDDAMAAYRRALALAPPYAEAHTNLGVLLREQGQIAAAVEHYRAAVAARPDFAPGLFNLGNALQALSLASPVETLSLYEAAVRLQPDYHEAHTNLGVLLKQTGRLDESVTAYQAALRLNPTFVEALSNLAVAYQDLGLLADARRTLEQAMALDPDFTEIHSNYLFIANYFPELSPQQLRDLHVRWTDTQVRGVEPWQLPSRDRRPDRRLRIGLVSPDLRMHPVGRFIAAWFEHHDRTQFETFVYADVQRADDWTAWLQARAAIWRDVRHWKHATLAEQIVADEIDVLVDLAGHTSHNRLPVFAMRPAPVQISYLGYPNTTGLTTIDYLITDAIADPPGYESHYTEHLLRLEPGFTCFYPPEVSPDVNELPAGESGMITFGGLHNLAKLNDDVLDLWADLLRATPNSRLLLVRDALCGSAKTRISDALVSRCIDATRFELRHELIGGHLAAYNQIDIALDTFPWSGHTTACEALWMGVPVVTLATDRHAGRMVASVLHSIGRDAWVATNRDQYLAIAQRLAGDHEQLATLRRNLRRELVASPLCDTVRFSDQLAGAFRQAWQSL
ncbi:MAG: tetratricopeptide repeat protein [Planctomycetaceae bacterium]|nr:tetratricopeptide repeat protein [Planctomycetaceae bacterium]